MLYPNLAGQFGSVFTVGKTSDFPAALAKNFQLDSAGVFYQQPAKTYVIHLESGTQFSLKNAADLKSQLDYEWVLKDEASGTYWIALYQKCVHLGCTVPYRNDCDSFKCPCHGSHYNVDGEWLDGPAPRSLDRFRITINGDSVNVDTGQLNQAVPHPDDTTRLIAVPGIACSAS